MCWLRNGRPQATRSSSASARLARSSTASTELFLKPADRVEGGAQVAIVNPDGTGFEELTTGAGNNAFPILRAGRKEICLPYLRRGRPRVARDEPGRRSCDQADRGLR